MPYNLTPVEPTAVFPQSLCTSFAETHIYPLLSIGYNDGSFAPWLFAGKLFSQSIWGLDCVLGARSCGVAWNTVVEATLVGLLTTLLGLAFALVTVEVLFLATLFSVRFGHWAPVAIGAGFVAILGYWGYLTRRRRTVAAPEGGCPFASEP